MKKIFLLIVFVISSSLFSQQEKLQKQFKVDFNFMGLGFSYEVPLSEKWVVDLSAGVGGGYRINNGFKATWVFNSHLASYFKSEFKRYYNREKRRKKGKRDINNSGSYIAFQTKYNSRRFSLSKITAPLDNALLNEVHWGVQRPFDERWLFNFHAGVGYAIDLNSSQGSLYPALGVKFSYKIF